MHFWDISGFAMRNFLRRKARSALTVLGVVIGTAAVVIMISIGVGMNVGFEKQISQWSDLRQITVQKSWSGGYVEEGASSDTLPTVGIMNKAGWESIKALPGVDACTPKYYAYFPLIKGREQADVSVMGIIPSEMEKFGYKIGIGRLLTADDTGTNNFVMTYNVPFNFRNPRKPYEWMEITEGMELPFDPTQSTYKFTFDYSYGRGFVDINRPKPKLYKAECVGILEQKKGGDYETTIFMDIDHVMKLQKEYEAEMQKYYESLNQESGGIVYRSSSSVRGASTENQDVYSEFMVLVNDTNKVQEVEKEIRKLGYETYSAMTSLTQMQEQTAFLRTILGAIGVVAFVVAAISISNTMIMSIYERTREIGIMKVLGCKLSNITNMFLFEAGIIGLCGGIIGVGASYGASKLLNYFSRDSGGILGFSSGIGAEVSVIPWWLMFVALGLAIVVGVVAGLYPALRATKLRAIEAIKNE